MIEWLASKGEVFEPLMPTRTGTASVMHSYPWPGRDLYQQQRASPSVPISGLFWHIDVLEGAGMDSTRDLNLCELDSWARKLTEFGPDDQIIGWVSHPDTTGTPLVWTFGGGVFDYGTRKPRSTSEISS